MRQTLLYIPHEMFGVPVFGMGWALGIWLAISVVFLFVLTRRHGWTSEVAGYLPLMAVFSIALYALLPMLEVRPPGLEPLGVPIRGYGMFVVAGIMAGMSLSIHRAKQIRLEPELIYSLAFWMFVIAIAGARLFYVIQKWDEFERETLIATAGAILKFTEGGLVVYGSIIGGVIGLYFFSRRHQIRMLELGDVIAPGMIIGSALGRIGCLMNGCCYGGVCESGPLAITFPKYAAVELRQYSSPYAHQLAIGELHGFRVAEDERQKVVVVDVESGTAAEAAGLRAGTKIHRLNGVEVKSLTSVQKILLAGPPRITINEDNVAWTIDALPPRSLPVHPTQIYSSINAALICLVLWFAYPFRRRHGDILLLLFGLYSVTRFLLEAIRTDEAGQLGTAFTISQIVSLCVFTLCVVCWLSLLRQPRIGGESMPAGESV
ncbi:MAG: prolipoprotein diacylglyceryl transferase [Planctomycetes bacterium]|nr:prolipoprotein diacylglyceryl transferase [Planctomycetota bacterium]